MPEDTNPATQRAALAEAFDSDIDPLADVADTFEATGVDPFALYLEESVRARDLAASSERNFEILFAEWRSFMADQGRHLACPAPEHVTAYIDWQTRPEAEDGQGNTNRTVKEKLRKLSQAYRYWQQDAVFPHPEGYDPFYLARKRADLTVRKDREHRRISLADLREMVASVTDLRSRALIAMQLKLGLRAGEVANCRLGDLRLDDAEATEYLPALGTHERLVDHPDAIYVRSKHERAGNKSGCPRLLPLDDELRTLLDRYLLVRPDNGTPWLFLSKKSHSQVTNKGVNRVWKDAFHPEYAGTDEHRPVTSHFGRHRFTTYWRVEQDLNRQLVKYMRGDRTGAYENARGMDAYLHAYYADIEPVYRARMYDLRLEPLA